MRERARRVGMESLSDNPSTGRTPYEIPLDVAILILHESDISMENRSRRFTACMINDNGSR